MDIIIPILLDLFPGRYLVLLVLLLFILTYLYERHPSPTQSLGQPPQSPQEELVILAAAVAGLQFYQLILSRERFQLNHLLVQWGAWAAYYAPLPLAAFAVGVMIRFRPPFWLVAIFFAAGQADTMAAYGLDDDRQGVRRFAKRALSLAYLIILALTCCKQPLARARWIEMCSLLLGLGVFLTDLKISRMAAIPSSDICMVAAEGARSKDEGRRRRPAPPGGSQQGRRAAVVAVGSLESRRSAVSGCTTYEDILELNCSAELKDACLSSALFLQLLPRHDRPHHQGDVDSSSSVNQFKILLVENNENHTIALKLVHQGHVDLNEYKKILAEQNRNCTRAFKVVEVQLRFLYDYIFSAHGSPSCNLNWLYLYYSVIKIVFLLSITPSLFLYPVEEGVAKPELATSACAICALVFLELTHLVVQLISNWVLVSYMCDEVAMMNSRHGSRILFVKFLRAIFELIIAGCQEHTWQNRLGQYSLIEDFDHTSLIQRFMARLLGRPRRGTLAASPAALSEEVKKRLIDKAADPMPWGFKSDVPLSPPQMEWAFRQETEIHTVLIWHIATWFCARTDAEQRLYKQEVLSSSDYVVAAELSSYCAYLVAFRPELLPGHHSVTTSILDKAVKEAEFSFRGVPRHNRRQYMWDRMVQGSSDDEGGGGDDKWLYLPNQVILKLGAKLARQLLLMDDRWKIMADFWAEMLLLVAQSGDTKAHIEHLARGGEFVTHIWALLYNAGMHQDRTFIKRNQDGGDKSEQAYKYKGKGKEHTS